nr:hypothetical protein [uncultured Dyadobacter sp.]
MISGNDLLNIAVRNNAEWCSIVCDSHGVLGNWEPSFWSCARQPPMFYPNIISLNPICDLQTIGRKIAELEGSLSIKDAYDSLGLGTLGFARLFKAHWLLAPLVAHAPLPYHFVSTGDELARWQNAWNDGNGHDVFKKSLLAHPDVRIIAIYSQECLVSGAIINRSGVIAGITNFFCKASDFDACYLTCIAAARSVWPVQEVITYEREQNMEAYKAMGMSEMGGLSVWVTSALN